MSNEVTKDELMNLWLETFQKGLKPSQVQARINFIVDSMKNPNSITYTCKGFNNFELHQMIQIKDEIKNIDDLYMVYEIEQKQDDYKITLIKYSYFEKLRKIDI